MLRSELRSELRSVPSSLTVHLLKQYFPSHVLKRVITVVQPVKTNLTFLALTFILALLIYLFVVYVMMNTHHHAQFLSPLTCMFFKYVLIQQYCILLPNVQHGVILTWYLFSLLCLTTWKDFWFTRWSETKSARAQTFRGEYIETSLLSCSFSALIIRFTLLHSVTPSVFVKLKMQKSAVSLSTGLFLQFSAFPQIDWSDFA